MKTNILEELEDKYISKKSTEKRNKYEQELREGLVRILSIIKGFVTEN